MEDRTLSYEENFKKYLFKGDVDRFLSICKNISIENNLPLFTKDREETVKKFMEVKEE